MGIIQELLENVLLPKMVKIRQVFEAPEVEDLDAELRKEIAKPGIGDRILQGQRIAITVGSRGVAEIDNIARIIVEEVKARGGEPFIIPAMGSHGGATAEGQKQVLADLGVTEETMKCPIISSMEVVEVGRLENGLAVLIDKEAYEADGIIVVNRVKPHTAFRGPCESGLAKMITIGLGKQKGADSCHAYSFKHMAEHVLRMAEIKLKKTKIIFGVGTVENAYDKVARIFAVTPEELIEVDQKMLIEARARMGRIMFDQIDVLVVDQLGKEISGDGMDPNITGRYPTPDASGGPDVNKLVVLNLTEQTHGNANGLGTADFTTRKVFENFNFESTYTNCLTSTIAIPAKIPIVMESDQEALKAAVKTCNALDNTKARIVRIKDTLHLEEIYISEAQLEEARANTSIELLSEAFEFSFDENGNLIGTK